MQQNKSTWNDNAQMEAVRMHNCLLGPFEEILDLECCPRHVPGHQMATKKQFVMVRPDMRLWTR